MSHMVIALTRGSMENLLVASTVAGGAVAMDMDVDIYLLLGGAYALRRDVVEREAQYYDHPELKDQLLDGLHRNSIPTPLESLRQLKDQGRVRIHVCSTAGKIWDASTLSDFSDLVDDIVGIVQYLSQVEEADIVQVL